jgi:hypothetical protein
MGAVLRSKESPTARKYSNQFPAEDLFIEVEVEVSI